MSVQTRHPRVNSSWLAILFFLATVVSATHAQLLIVRQNAPRAGEIATQQIGGAGWFTSYGFVGALRCTKDVPTYSGFVKRTDAIVGVRIRKGTLVDFMQVECAPLEPAARGGLTWQQANMYNGGWAGNSQGGYMSRFTNCPLGYVISGFKAIYAGGNNFLSDIRFECSQISGSGIHSSPMGFQKYFQITTNSNRQWISWYAGDTAIRSYSLGYNAYAIAKAVPDTIDLAPRTQLKPESACTDGGAAALSVAVGTDVSLTGPHQVVQAFQMFCYGGTTDEIKADPYLDPFEHGN